MPESGPFGSVRGVCSNAHPYRDIGALQVAHGFGETRRIAGQLNFLNVRPGKEPTAGQASAIRECTLRASKGDHRWSLIGPKAVTH